MAHEHLRSQPVAVALAAEVADAALAPVEALIPRGAADYLRERVDNLLFLHPVVSTVFARVVKARLAAMPADDDELELPIAAIKPDRARKLPEPANDVGPVTPAEIERRRRDALVLGATPIAKALARSYARRGAGAFEDLAQDAMLAIVHCASTFDGRR